MVSRVGVGGSEGSLGFSILQVDNKDISCIIHISTLEHFKSMEVGVREFLK